MEETPASAFQSLFCSTCAHWVRGYMGPRTVMEMCFLSFIYILPYWTKPSVTQT